MRELSCPAVVSGRVLIDAPTDPVDWLIVGLHGYGETAVQQFERQASAVPSHSAHVAIEALHTFYSRGSRGAIGASWLTSDRREQRLAENKAYLSAVLEQIAFAGLSWRRLAWAGFSQGVGQTLRAASALGGDAVIALAGDIPPELDSAALAALPSILIGRGEDDRLYNAERFSTDQQRLSEAGCQAQAWTGLCGHEWTPAWNDRCRAFLSAL